MLEELRIRGLGVIDEAVLPLGPGLTAVTGETGAGKTMVVTGLLLLYGERADAARVRTGVEQASVDGRVLAVPAAVAERVRAAGGDLDETDHGAELALRRVVSASGRSRAYVGGAPAPVGLLAELADRLVAVHGQTDQLRLTRHSEQLDLLDRYGEIDREPYAAAFAAWRTAAAALSERTARAAELRREADLLTFGLGEIDAAAPEPGEDRALADLAARLGQADALREAAATARVALSGTDDPADEPVDVASALGQARRALSQVAGTDAELDKLGTRIEDLLAGVGELTSDLRGYLDGLDADPQRLDEVQQRRSVLGALVRKYGHDAPGAADADGQATLDAVLAWADAARARLADLDVSDEAIAALTAARDAAAADAARQAAVLSEARLGAANRLSEAVTAELAGLAMAGASISVQVTRRHPAAGQPQLELPDGAAGAGPDGVDDVEILLRPHPQSPQLPIGRGASGGELSRVMLALEVCLAGTDPVPTMVFDEVDAGVGGRAAVEVGRRLARLARDHQVLVVTHLAQVAAYADRHIVVDRDPASATPDTVTASDVRIVTDADRETELARMLAGSDSATARQHAAELLAEARSDRAAENPKKRPKTRR